jgi:hypothetical protein
MSLSGGNGLERQPQLIADKIATVPKSKIGKRVGRLDDQDGHHQRRGQRFSAQGLLRSAWEDHPPSKSRATRP